MAKERNWRLTTYLSEEQINLVLDEHQHQIKAYAYILHDKDTQDNGLLKEAHYHILLALNEKNSLTAILKWFDGFTDESGKDITTLAKVMNNPKGAYGYLTHNTCRSQSKYQYDESCIVSFNPDFFLTFEEAPDSLSLAFDDLVDGIPLNEIRKRYGRDFIIHYNHIRALFNDIQIQQGGKCLGER